MSHYTSCSLYNKNKVSECGDYKSDHQLQKASHLNDHYEHDGNIIATEIELLASRCGLKPESLKAICPKHRHKFDWRDDIKQCQYLGCMKNERLLRASKNLSLCIKAKKNDSKFPLLGYVCLSCQYCLSNDTIIANPNLELYLPQTDYGSHADSARSTKLKTTVSSAGEADSELYIAHQTNRPGEPSIEVNASKLDANQLAENPSTNKYNDTPVNTTPFKDKSDQLPVSPTNEIGFLVKDAADNLNNDNPYYTSSHYSNTPQNKYKSNHDSSESSYQRSALNRPYLTGLTNIGNTCFMNSALQCIVHLPELRRIFLSDSWRQTLNRKNPLGSGGRVAEKFYLLLKEFMSSNSVNRSISTKPLKDEVAKFNPIFSGYDQQDSHQFLNSLLDALHEDLKSSEQSDLSPISRYFHGTTVSEITCKRCQRNCEPYPEELFSSLSLSISRKPDLTLEQCISDFSSEQHQTENSQWYCSYCKRLSQSITKTYIKNLPHILIIHFKRYDFVPTSYEHISTLIRYPFELEIPPNQQWRPISTKYQLQSIGLKQGSLLSGHAYTHAKAEDGKWYCFNDSIVKLIDIEKYSPSHHAYILVYRRMDEQ